MARKVRRVRRRSTHSQTNSTSSESKLTTEEALREEYAYVLRDLRRVAILAAALFFLLIALNLLLR